MKTFTISDTEEETLTVCLKEHNKTCKFHDDGSSPSHPCGAIGGRFTYEFTPTGIGTAIRVRCACDDWEIDLTDYDMW